MEYELSAFPIICDGVQVSICGNRTGLMAFRGADVCVGVLCLCNIALPRIKRMDFFIPRQVRLQLV